MITTENKQQLEELLNSPLSKEDILKRINGQYDLEWARAQAFELVQRMTFAFWEGINAGAYDDILWDMNAMIDRTQEIMIKAEMEKQKLALEEKRKKDEAIALEETKGQKQETIDTTSENTEVVDDPGEHDPAIDINPDEENE